MIVTLERLAQLLDEIAGGLCEATLVRQLAEGTGQPTTLVRLRALKRGLMVERNTVYSRGPGKPY